MPDTSIRAVRQAKGLTLQDVAERMGTTAVTVSRWEREPQRVTIPVLTNLAVALGCTREELLGGCKPLEGYGLETSSKEVIANYYGIATEHVGVMEEQTDTMEPTIQRGARCFLDLSVTDVDGSGIYALRFEDTLRCVRAHSMFDGRVRIVADNPLYQINFTVEHGQLEVVGKVMGCTKNF